jgi:hypothetical protein
MASGNFMRNIAFPYFTIDTKPTKLCLYMVILGVLRKNNYGKIRYINLNVEQKQRVSYIYIYIYIYIY